MTSHATGLTVVFATIAVGLAACGPHATVTAPVTVTHSAAAVTAPLPPRTHARTLVVTPRHARPRRGDQPLAGVRANLLRIAHCESTDHWHDNTGNGEYGGLQFDYTTWLSNGGGRYAPRADLATKDQQLTIATILVARRGYQPWPICGRLA